MRRTTSSALIGRSQELQFGERVLAAAERGPAGLVLRGEPGIGKTALVEELRRRASARGMRVLHCAPGESEASLALAGLGDLLAGVAPEVGPSLPAPQRRALEVALLLRNRSGPPLDPRALGMAVLAVLDRLSTAQPVLVAVDDLQWLDETSAGALVFALRRIGDRRVGTLISTRLAGGEPLPADAGRLLGGMTELTVGPLSVAALFALLRDVAGLELSRPQLVRLHTACGGNPLHALVIARELREGRLRLSPGEPVPLPASLLALVELRMARLPMRAREVLAGAASLSHPSAEVLDEAFGPKVVERAIGRAARAGIADLDHGAIRFAHPLFASASYAALRPHVRRVIHRRLAAVVDDPEEHARQLALGSARRNEEAAKALAAAAAGAAARGAPASAAELAALAVELTPRSESALVERELHEAEYVFLSGDAGRAEAAVNAVVSRLGPGATRARAKLLAARIAWEVRGSVAACRLCDEAIAEAEGEPGLAGEAHTWAAEFSDFDEAARSRHARAAVALLERARPLDEARLAAALKALAESELVLGRGLPRDVVERAIMLQREHLPYRVSDRVEVALGWWLVWTDELDEARGRLEAGHATARAEGDESSMPQITGWLRELELRVGHLGLAHEYAAAQLQAAEQLGERLWMAVAGARMAIVESHLGLADEARRHALDALHVAGEKEDAGLALLCEWALGSLELSVGNAVEATRWLLRADATHEQVGLVEPGYARFHADLVEALVAVGRLDEAESHLQEYERRAALTARRSALGGAARCRALLLGACGAGEDALDHVGRAHEALDSLGTPFELARTDLVEGVVLRRLRRRGEARVAFDRARAGFATVGASVWQRRAEAELARTGLRRRTGAGLTDTERRVATLAARGLTNREIAASVFLTEKSVEDVLRRVYRLVGVRNKTELASRLAEHP